MSAPRVAFFDLNATTLDLAPVAAALEGPEAGDGPLVASALDTAIAVAATAREAGTGTDFAGALRTGLAIELERRRGETPAASELTAAMAAIADARPFPETAEALAVLRSAGTEPWVLTNSSREAADAALGAGELSGAFAGVVSVEEAGALKPARQVYELALASAGVTGGDAALVSCHWWDLEGAAAVGIRLAYVERSGKPLPEALGLELDVRGPDLLAVARGLGAG